MQLKRKNPTQPIGILLTLHSQEEKIDQGKPGSMVGRGTEEEGDI